MKYFIIILSALFASCTSYTSPSKETCQVFKDAVIASQNAGRKAVTCKDSLSRVEFLQAEALVWKLAKEEEQHRLVGMHK